MRSFFVKSQQSFISSVTLCTSLFHVLSANFCYTQNAEQSLLAASEVSLGNRDEPKYTVNFNHVPVIEVIRFVSKITHTNFVFEESDLQFNVSIVSEEPISVKNIMSALIQVLRIHDLRLLEQENNLIITRSIAVNQISTIVSADLPGSSETESPIVTRVFRIKNASASSIATIIRPMVSASSQIEVSEETRQLIVTDITTNIDKIAALLISLDTPHTRLEIESYVVKHISPADIISLTHQILSAFAEGNPLILVPQAETNTVFIVSTPYLIERAITVMEDLDTVPKNMVISSKPLESQDVYVYKIVNKTPEEVLSDLKTISEQIKVSYPSMPSPLIQAISTVKFIPDTYSLVFVTDPTTWGKLQTILTGIDTLPYSGALGENSFWIYKIQNVPFAQIEASLEQMAAKVQDRYLARALKDAQWIKETNSIIFNAPESILKKLQNIIPSLDAPTAGEQHYVFKLSTIPEDSLRASLKQTAEGLNDRELVNTIQNAKWIKESNSLIFNGSSETIEKLKSILPAFENNQQASLAAKSHFLIYNPVNQKGETLEKDLKELAGNLKNSGLENSQFLLSLESIKWVPGTNSLIFTGDSESLDRVKGILSNLDQQLAGNAPVQVFVYKPEYSSYEQLKSALDLFANNLGKNSISDQELASAIQNAQWITESNSILFKANTETITRLKETLTSLDNPNSFGGTSHNFYLYKLQSAQGSTVILNLKMLADNISSSDSKNAAVIKSIHSLKWVKENNALLITGSTYTIEQVKALIGEFDTPASSTGLLSAKTEFFIYKPINQTSEIIHSSLEDFAKDLELSGLSDPDFIHTLRSAKIVPETKSILFTGTPDALGKLKHLLLSVDASSSHAAPIQTIGATTFLIYKIQNASAPELMNSLQTFSKQLNLADISDKKLSTVLDSVKWIKETNSLLFTGSEETLQQAEKVVEKFDLTTLQAPTRAGAASFFVYEPKYQSGDELISILTEFMENLSHSGVSDPSLFDAIHHLKFISKTDSLVISGDPGSIDKIKELLVKFDIPRQGAAQPSISSIDTANFLIYKLQYHKGVEIQTALKKVAASLVSGENQDNSKLIHCINSLQWIEVTNSLLGTGDPDILVKVKGLIQSLDVPLRQVFIEILVIRTDLSNSQEFGLQWGSQLQYMNKTIGAMGNFPQTGNILQNPLSLTTAGNPPVQGNGSSNSVPFTNGFDLGVIGDIIFHKGQSFLSLGSLLNALQLDTDTTIVMNPKVMTQDGHTSNIFVGDNIPFVGSFVSNTSQSTVQTSNIEYRDVGFNLIVTPTLGTNNVITLEINQDVSNVVNISSTNNGTTVNGITTHHATMTTRVHVPDRHFLVLSGMVQDTKAHSRSGIPCLGGLPMVGALFSDDLITDAKENVIIFMKPYIVNSFEDYDHLTDQQVSLFKDQAVLPDLKEGFDAGVEMLKSIEND